jgi:phenylacetate-CoA ligase
MNLISSKHARFAFRHLVRDNALCSMRLKRLIGHERWSAADSLKYQARMLVRTLHAAQQRIPAYSALNLADAEEDPCAFLRRACPVIDKSDLLMRRSLYFPHHGRAYPWTIHGRTSGTTGTPLDTFRSVDSVIWENAFLKRHWAWSGFEEGMPHAALRGDMVIPLEQTRPPFWFHNRFSNQLLVSSVHLKEEYMGFIVEALTRFRPHMLRAYPSTAFLLAGFLERESAGLAIPFVYTGSEMLTPGQRGLIEARVGKVLDFYGMAERVILATECEHGRMHVNTDYSFVEILDEQGRPTDGEGFLVGTSFHNLLMPLIRYRMSDRTKWDHAPCPCGRSYPVITAIAGRLEDVVFASDGRPISPTTITFALKRPRHIACCQVAQVAHGTWEVRVEPLDGYSEQDGMEIIQNIHHYVDANLELRLRTVRRIPRTTTGKFRAVVNET